MKAVTWYRAVDVLGLDEWEWVDPRSLNFSQAYVSDNVGSYVGFAK